MCSPTNELCGVKITFSISQSGLLIASGSSYNSSAIGAKFIAKYAKTESLFFYSGEVVISNDFEVNKDTLYVFTSQSGETADTNLALDKIKQFTDKILVITNTKHSRLWNSAKYKIFTMADSEKAIASTKSMTAQLFCILLVGIKLMQMNNIPYKKYIDDFCNLSKNISDILLKRKEIQYYAKSLSECENAVILGSEIFYYTAIEGTLKFTETSYINTSAFPTGEFLHGHIAILNKKCFVIK